MTLTLFLLATTVIFYQARSRIQGTIAQSGKPLVQLLNNEVSRTKGLFQFSLDNLDDLSLKSVSEIGSSIGICIEVRDIYNRPAVTQCFGSTARAPNIISWALDKILDTDAHFDSPLLASNSSVVVGHVTTYPNITHESNLVWQNLRIVIVMTFGILFLNGLVYWPVRRALQPADEILKTISLLESGNLTARMPKPELLELRRISVGFDHLTNRLQQTIAAQRQLAKRLLTAREEERRHLARELHDELGQLLTAISADSAFLASRLKHADPGSLPAVEAIKINVARVMDNIQNMLSQLRPHGLDEFGLEPTLMHLTDNWEKKIPGLAIPLTINGDLQDFEADLNITIYRIVQESLTNALKHGNPTLIQVSITREDNQVEIVISDNGNTNVDNEISQGNGVIGMTERVSALDGDIKIVPKETGGVCVTATMKLELDNN